MREAINVGLTKLGFKEIRENQRKVVEAYVGGRDVLMVAPTGSGKSLTFHIAPFVLDFYTHGERDLVDTVCLVIFPLVSLMKDQGSKPLSWAQKLPRENTTSCSRVPKRYLAVIVPVYWH